MTATRVTLGPRHTRDKIDLEGTITDAGAPRDITTDRIVFELVREGVTRDSDNGVGEVEFTDAVNGKYQVHFAALALAGLAGIHELEVVHYASGGLQNRVTVVDGSLTLVEAGAPVHT